MGKEDIKLLERVFFSYFAKKLRMTKPDDTLLEMLLPYNPTRTQEAYHLDYIKKGWAP